MAHQVPHRPQRTDLPRDGQGHRQGRVDLSSADVAKALDQGGHGQAAGEGDHQPVGRRAEDVGGAVPGEVGGAEEKDVEEGGEALGHRRAP